MEPLPSAVERSIRSCPNRRRVLVTLSSLSEAYVGQLSRATGIAHFRVRACLLGGHPDYRDDLSLVALGLARAVSTARGRHFEITTRGRRKARSLTARAQGSRARPRLLPP